MVAVPALFLTERIHPWEGVVGNVTDGGEGGGELASVLTFKRAWRFHVLPTYFYESLGLFCPYTSSFACLHVYPLLLYVKALLNTLVVCFWKELTK